MIDFFSGMLFAAVLQMASGIIVLLCMYIKLRRKELEASKNKYIFFDIVCKNHEKIRQSSKNENR